MWKNFFWTMNVSFREPLIHVLSVSNKFSKPSLLTRNNCSGAVTFLEANEPISPN